MLLGGSGEDLGRVLGGFGKGLRKVWTRIKQFRINVSSMQGGGRCLRQAVSIFAWCSLSSNLFHQRQK